MENVNNNLTETYDVFKWQSPFISTYFFTNLTETYDVFKCSIV